MAIGSTAKTKKPDSFPPNEVGNGQYFADLFRNKLRFDHKRRRWLVWSENWWAPDTDGTVMRMAKEAVIHRLRVAVNITDDKKRELEVAWAMGSQSRYRLQSMIILAQSEIPLADDGEQWDVNAWLLGVENGVVNLRTGKLREGRPQDRITMHCPVAFDPNAECPRWLRFLEEVFVERDLIDYTQRIGGYCLTGSTREQVVFMFFGKGRNGKGTYVETMRHVMGPYSYNLPFSAFDAKARSSISNDVAAMNGMRLITASETDESTKLNIARIKSISGEDKQAGRFLYHQLFNFDPTAKLILSFNYKPAIQDDSIACWDRIRLLTFPKSFIGSARDSDLREKLKAEAPGILAWAVEGCLKWQREGLGLPSTVQAATEEYRKRSNSLEAFLLECCTAKPGLSVSVSALWEEYEQWAKDNPEYPELKHGQFSERLGGRGFKRDRAGKQRTRVWVGLSLGADK